MTQNNLSSSQHQGAEPIPVHKTIHMAYHVTDAKAKYSSPGIQTYFSGDVKL